MFSVFFRELVYLILKRIRVLRGGNIGQAVRGFRQLRSGREVIVDKCFGRLVRCFSDYLGRRGCVFFSGGSCWEQSVVGFCVLEGGRRGRTCCFRGDSCRAGFIFSFIFQLRIQELGFYRILGVSVLRSVLIFFFLLFGVFLLFQSGQGVVLQRDLKF